MQLNLHSPLTSSASSSSEVLTTHKELRILGVMVQGDLGWDAQVKFMIEKASNKIWQLRRMKQLGVDESTITTYWRSEGLVHLEYCAPLWSGGLNLGQERALQTVARRAVAAITGPTREEYTDTCRRLGLEPDLAARRLQLCRRFALRTATRSRHQDLFTKLDNPHITRGGGKVWREPPCRTKRHLHSALPHLTRLLNGENS